MTSPAASTQQIPHANARNVLTSPEAHTRPSRPDRCGIILIGTTAPWGGIPPFYLKEFALGWMLSKVSTALLDSLDTRFECLNP